MHVDRHLAIWGGWIAGPAFGVAMMAAPEVLHLTPHKAAALFYGGIIVFMVTIVVMVSLSFGEKEQKSMWPILAMAVGVIIFGGGAAAYFWPSSTVDVAKTGKPPETPASGSAASAEMPSILTLFMTDIKPNGVMWQAMVEIDVNNGKFKLPVYYNLYNNFTDNSKFVSFFVPHSDYTVDVIKHLAGAYPKLMTDIETQHWAVAKYQGDSHESDSKALTFSGRVYVYHEDSLNLEDAAALSAAFRENKASAQFRGLDHALAVLSSIRSGDIKPPAKHEIKNGYPQQIPSPPTTAQEIATRISIECAQEILPRTLKADETIQVLWLFPLPVANGGGGLVSQFNRSGEAWKWPVTEAKNAIFLTAYRCELTNYGSGPVIDFDMALDLTFYEAVPVAGQSDSTRGHGKIKLHRDWQIRIQKLDSGRENSYKFYLINNQPDLFVHVLMPKTATLRLLGDEKRIQSPLDVAQLGREIPLLFAPSFMPASVADGKK